MNGNCACCRFSLVFQLMRHWLCVNCVNTRSSQYWQKPVQTKPENIWRRSEAALSFYHCSSLLRKTWLQLPWRKRVLLQQSCGLNMQDFAIVTNLCNDFMHSIVTKVWTCPQVKWNFSGACSNVAWPCLTGATSDSYRCDHTLLVPPVTHIGESRTQTKCASQAQVHWMKSRPLTVESVKKSLVGRKEILALIPFCQWTYFFTCAEVVWKFCIQCIYFPDTTSSAFVHNSVSVW